MTELGNPNTSQLPDEEPGGQFHTLVHATEMVAQLMNLIRESNENTDGGPEFEIKEIRVRRAKTIWTGERIVVSAINFDGQPFIYALFSENGGDPIADGY